MEIFKSIILEFIKFIKKPDDTQFQWGFLQKIRLFFVIFLLEMVVVLCWTILLYYLIPLDSPRFEYKYTFSFILAFIVLIVPLLEEFFFRYGLRYKGIIKKCVKRETWERIFPFLVYSSVICFGFMHIFNSENVKPWQYALFPIFVTSQLLGGFILSFLRVRLNFRWAVLYHCFWNLTAVTFSFVGIKNFEDKTDKYTLKIEEKMFFDASKPQIIKIDSVQRDIVSLDVKQYSLRHILDTLYGKNTYYVDDILVNLNLLSEKGISEDEFIAILRKEYKIRKNK